jgi:hypothetical protein
MTEPEINSVRNMISMSDQFMHRDQPKFILWALVAIRYLLARQIIDYENRNSSTK